MMANKQVWCGIAGWTTRQFDAAVVKGFPAHKKTSSRGDIWQVDTRDGIAWMVEQEAAKPRPRPRSTLRTAPPPGLEAFKAATSIDNPVQQACVATLLLVLYGLPRLTANVLADFGVGIDDAHRTSVSLLFTVWEHCRRELPFWPQDPDTIPMLHEAFEPINWPYLTQAAGEPDWRPRLFGFGWSDVTEEEHAEAVRHGEEIEAKYAAMEQDDAA